MFRYDITYCANDKCEKTDCRRHHTKSPVGTRYSQALFNDKNRKKCDYYLKGDKRDINGQDR